MFDFLFKKKDYKNVIIKEMIELNADGVVFHSLRKTHEELYNGDFNMFCDYRLEEVKKWKRFRTPVGLTTG